MAREGLEPRRVASWLLNYHNDTRITLFIGTLQTFTALNKVRCRLLLHLTKYDTDFKVRCRLLLHLRNAYRLVERQVHR